MKEKIVHEAMARIYEASMSGRLPLDLIGEMLAKAYDAGAVETPDQDAARWRMFVAHFGKFKARFVRNVCFLPKMDFRYPPPVDGPYARRGAEWRIDFAWSEKTGNADTIPKFVDLMLDNYRDG